MNRIEPDPMVERHQHRGTVAGFNPRLLIKGILVMACLAATGWSIKASGLGDMLDTHWVDTAVRGRGASGELVFVVVGAVAVAVGLPRQAVCFLAGYAFGLGWGSVLGTLASILGGVACFLFARMLGRELVLHKFAARVRRVDDFLHDNPFTMTVLIRFLPVGSNLLTNLVAGVSSVRTVPFVLGTLLGYMPQTIIFVLLGSGIRVDPILRISLSVVLFVLSAAMGVYLYKRLRHGHSLGAAIDQAIDADEGTKADQPGI
jgi:uncharacterized membrane protein YdjX (TVP38/TMEM64 family)